MLKYIKILIVILYGFTLFSVYIPALENIKKEHENTLKLAPQFFTFFKEKFNLDYLKFHELMKLDINNINHYKISIFLSIILVILAFIFPKIFLLLAYLNHFKMVIIFKELFKLSFNKLILNIDFIHLIGLFGITLFLFSTSCQNKKKIK